jgi:uncharacterized protein YecT (DUF1311 family)
VFSIVPFVGLLAVLVGLLAVRDIHRHPQKQGIGRARFAIAIGAVLSVVWAALFVLRDDLRLPPTSQVNGVTAGQLVVDRQAPVRAATSNATQVVAPGAVVSMATASPTAEPAASMAPPSPTVPAESPATAASAATAMSGASAVAVPTSAVAPVTSGRAGLTGLADESTGPSFDCKKSPTMAETVICASKSLSALDREQAAAFNKALAQASGDQITTLRESQASWQHERNDLCGSDGKCIERYMRARLATFAPPPKKSTATPSP